MFVWKGSLNCLTTWILYQTLWQMRKISNYCCHCLFSTTTAKSAAGWFTRLIILAPLDWLNQHQDPTIPYQGYLHEAADGTAPPPELGPSLRIVQEAILTIACSGCPRASPGPSTRRWIPATWPAGCSTSSRCSRAVTGWWPHQRPCSAAATSAWPHPEVSSLTQRPIPRWSRRWSTGFRKTRTTCPTESRSTAPTRPCWTSSSPCPRRAATTGSTSRPRWTERPASSRRSTSQLPFRCGRAP